MSVRGRRPCGLLTLCWLLTACRCIPRLCRAAAARNGSQLWKMSRSGGPALNRGARLRFVPVYGWLNSDVIRLGEGISTADWLHPAYKLLTSLPQLVRHQSTPIGGNQQLGEAGWSVCSRCAGSARVSRRRPIVCGAQAAAEATARERMWMCQMPAVVIFTEIKFVARSKRCAGRRMLPGFLSSVLLLSEKRLKTCAVSGAPLVAVDERCKWTQSVLLLHQN